MEQFIGQLSLCYFCPILAIAQIGRAALNVFIHNNIDYTYLIQDLKEHIIEIAQKLSIKQINVLDTKGNNLQSLAIYQ